jgi:hypothetical protein
MPDQRPPRPVATIVKRIALFLVIMVAAFVAIYEVAVYLLGGAHDAIVTAAAALSALLASVINDRIWSKLQRGAG